MTDPVTGRSEPLDLPALVGTVRARQAARGRPLGPGPAHVPRLGPAVGEPRPLLAALGDLLAGTAEASGTPERPASWVLVRRSSGAWRFAGTCGELPKGTAERIAEDLPAARFDRRACGAWTLDLPARWLRSDEN